MKEITFRFESAELAKDFLGYMSDGGGEYRFILPGEDPRDIEFDYHSANRGKFGPIVIVKGSGEMREPKEVEPPTPGEMTIDEFEVIWGKRDLFAEFKVWYAQKHEMDDPQTWPKKLTEGEWFDTFGNFVSGEVSGQF
jgi:hypothetical protein